MLTLEWIGKNKVVNHHQEVPFRVLERQYSFGEQGQHTENNDSENMIIHGDNLEALKALLPQYEGKVKCIYIVILTPILMSILSSENAVRLNFIIDIKNSIFQNSLIFQGLPPVKYPNLMYFPLFLPLPAETRENFYASPTTLSKSLAEVRFASLVEWA